MANRSDLDSAWAFIVPVALGIAAALVYGAVRFLL